MGQSRISDNFSLYIWRSSDSPGTLYLAREVDTAEALCQGLTQDGYIVKVIHMATNTEFQLRDAKLCPIAQDPSSRTLTRNSPSRKRPSSQGMSQAFA